MFFLQDGYAKLSDAVAAIKDNNEGIKLSRKERKEITDALDLHLKNSLNETKLREKDGDILNLFNKIKTDVNITEEDKSKLFEDLFKYNENKLPCIATSFITTENRVKLGQILKGYREMLLDGKFSESEIECFDKYILNPLNANNIRHNIEEVTPQENDIFIKLEYDTGKDFLVSSKNKELSIKVAYVRKYINSSWVRIDGYIGIYGKWIFIEPKLLEVYKNGTLSNEAGEIKGENLGAGSFSFSSNSDHVLVAVGGRNTGSEQGKGHIFNTKPIDMSSYNKLDVTFEMTGDSYSGGSPIAKASIRVLSEKGEIIASRDIGTSVVASGSYSALKISNGTYSLDVSSINKPASVSFYIYSTTSLQGYYTSRAKIYGISLSSEQGN
jgi:hypothetical protein